MFYFIRCMFSCHYPYATHPQKHVYTKCVATNFSTFLLLIPMEFCNFAAEW